MSQHYPRLVVSLLALSIWGHPLLAASFHERFNEEAFANQPVEAWSTSSHLHARIMKAQGDSYPERIRTVKDLLSVYFEPSRMDEMLSIFGDLMVFEPDRLVFFEKVLAWFSLERSGRSFSRRNLRLLLDWISGSRIESGMAFDEFSDSFAKRVVMHRVRGGIRREAWMAHMASEGESDEDYFKHMLFGLTAFKGIRDRSRVFHSRLVQPIKTLVRLPMKSDHFFEVWMGPVTIVRETRTVVRRFYLLRNNADVIRELADAQQSSVKGVILRNILPTPFVFFFDLRIVRDALHVEGFQPFLPLDPEMDLVFPMAADAIRRAEREWLFVLLERAEEIVQRAWPNESSNIQAIEMNSTGFLTLHFPRLAAETAIRRYTHFAMDMGFSPIEWDVEEAQMHLTGFRKWRLTLSA